MKQTKSNQVVIVILYPLALLSLLGLLSLIPQLYDLPLNEESVYWRNWRIVVLASIIPMGLYFVGLSDIRSWQDKITYCLFNSFALYFPPVVSLIWILIKSFALLEWKIPLYDELGLILSTGVVISCLILFFIIKKI